jgi:GNAT superfamily N-acetyltransferase
MPGLSRIVWRRAGMEGMLWIGGLEKQLDLENRLSYGDLVRLGDVGACRILEFFYRERPISRDSRVGYAITLQRPTRVVVSRVVVPERRREGYGREILGILAAECERRNLRRLVAEVDERAVGVQQFLSACGFHASATIRRNRSTAVQFERRVDDREPTPFEAIDCREEIPARGE